jgi:hypothetical protein
MASDGVPVISPVTRLVQGSQAPVSVTVQKPNGKPLPAGGHIAGSPIAGAQAPEKPAAKGNEVTVPAKRDADLDAIIAHMNKTLNDSGRPTQFRMDTSTGRKLIQQINPANGEVIGEFSAAEFPALARGLGVSGFLVDSHA